MVRRYTNGTIKYFNTGNLDSVRLNYTDGHRKRQQIIPGQIIYDSTFRLSKAGLILNGYGNEQPEKLSKEDMRKLRNLANYNQRKLIKSVKTLHPNNDYFVKPEKGAKYAKWTEEAIKKGYRGEQIEEYIRYRINRMKRLNVDPPNLPEVIVRPNIRRRLNALDIESFIPTYENILPHGQYIEAHLTESGKNLPIRSKTLSTHKFAEKFYPMSTSYAIIPDVKKAKEKYIENLRRAGRTTAYINQKAATWTPYAQSRINN